MTEKKDDQAELYTRGHFLSLMIAAFGGLIGLAMGGMGLGYFFSPAWKKKVETWSELGPVKDLPDGKPVKMDYIVRRQDGWMTVEGRNSAWVLRRGGDVVVYSPNCTHLGCAFRWDPNKQQFQCPCHLGVFSISGDVISGPPPRPLDRFQTKVEEGSLFILPTISHKEKSA